MLKKLQRKWLGITLAAIVFIALLPWLLGIWFEYQYRALIASYNKEGSVIVQVSQYDRGYLFSHVILQVQIVDPDIKMLFNSLEVSPDALHFTVNQSIQHGPIVATHYRKTRYQFELASVRNVIQFGLPAFPKLEDEDVVTFFGNYYKYFRIPAFNYISENNMRFQFLNGLQGVIRIYSGEKRIRANIELLNFQADDGDVFVSIPNATFYFNQAKATSGLWIGGVSILIPEIEGHDSEGGSFAINGISFDGDTRESSGKISDTRRLDIDKMNFSHQPMGPLHLVLSVNGLGASAIQNMIAAYQKILLEGERYESQLAYKLSILLPQVFGEGSEIRLNQFELKTQVGHLRMQGVMNWEAFAASPPTSIAELLSVSHAKGELSISKVLADKLLGVMSTLPYFRSVSLEARRTFLSLQLNVEMLSQQNFLMITYFADRGFITDDAGMRLITLQKNDAPMDVYSQELKDLFLKKEIMLPASYLLYWKYLSVRQTEDALDQSVATIQASFSQRLREQLAGWIKDGFVKEDKDDYVVSLDKQNEKIFLNGKVLDQ